MSKAIFVMRRGIVAPMLSGKTTEKEKLYDIDEAHSPALKQELKALRRADRWAEHNQIWYTAISAWVDTLDNDDVRPIAAHDVGALVAARAIPTVAVLLPRAEFFRRAKLRQLDEVTMELAERNRKVVTEQAARYGLHVVSSLRAALFALQGRKGRPFFAY